jgi:hypothetical protein
VDAGIRVHRVIIKVGVDIRGIRDPDEMAHVIGGTPREPANRGDPWLAVVPHFRAPRPARAARPGGSRPTGVHHRLRHRRLVQHAKRAPSGWMPDTGSGSGVAVLSGIPTAPTGHAIEGLRPG